MQRRLAQVGILMKHELRQDLKPCLLMSLFFSSKFGRKVVPQRWCRWAKADQNAIAKTSHDMMVLKTYRCVLSFYGICVLLWSNNCLKDVYLKLTWATQNVHD